MVLAKGKLHVRPMMNMAPRVDPEVLEQHLQRVVDQFLLVYGTPAAPGYASPSTGWGPS